MSEKVKKEVQKSSENGKQSLGTSTVKELAAILNETALSEIEYEVGDYRIRVVKHAAPVQTYAVPAAAPVYEVPQGPAAQPQAASSSGLSHDAASTYQNHPGLVRAPLVGTVYLCPQPEAANFIKEGGQVKEGDTLLIIEAMKVMNPVRAPKSGLIKAIFVTNGEPVEYDHGLVVIE